MKTIQIRCKAFAGETVRINQIQVDDAGIVSVWRDGCFVHCHALTSRTLGKIARCMTENNMLRPIGYYPPVLKSLVAGRATVTSK